MSNLAKSIEAAVQSLSAEQKAALVKALTGPAEPIAIIGMGCRMPAGGYGPEGFWKVLDGGVDAIREVPKDRWNIDELYDPDPSKPGKMSTRWGGFLDEVRAFDEGFFKISPREAAMMDPQQRIFLEVAWEALEDAGVAGPSLAGSRTGVFVGVSAVEYAIIDWPITSMDAYCSSGTSKCIIANRLSYQLDLRGPSLAVDTACSSSLVAVHLALRSLRAKESDLAIAAGVNAVLSPVLGVSYSKWGMMAPDGRCKTFDAKADGFVRGEGCGAVILKRLSDAVRDRDRIHAVIRGSATNQDGRSAGLTAPNLEAQIAVIKEALADAKLTPEQVSYIEAHGTGTALGDPIEIEALSEVFAGSKAPCAIGSVKTNLGHLEGAAGIAGLLKVVLAISHRRIPPHLNLETLSPKITFEGTPFSVPRSGQDWRPTGSRIAGISSFGFGGTNVHALLEEPPAAPPAPVLTAGLHRPLILSAHTAPALLEMLAQYRQALAATPERFAEIAYSATVRRARHAHRLAVVAVDATEADRALSALESGRPHPLAIAPKVAKKRVPRIGFVFTGQGSVWTGMAKRLLSTEPVFHAALVEHDRLVRPLLGESLVELIEVGSDKLQKTQFGQHAIFGIQLGLVRLFGARGVRPSAVVGHSVGEITAAVVAGAISVERGLEIIQKRGAILTEHEGEGGMAEVARPAAELASMLVGTGLAIAAINHPTAAVISGPRAELDAFAERYRSDGITVRPLDVRCAFHGLALRRQGGALAEQLKGPLPNKTDVPFYSTVSGARLEGPSLDAAHFGRNLAEPVRFADAVLKMIEDGVEVFLELGPHASLCRSISAVAGKNDVTAVPTLQKNQDDQASIALALSRLDLEGITIDWKSAAPEGPLPHWAPPRYPWQHQSFWGTVPSPERRRGSSPHPLILERVISPSLGTDVFELDLESPIVTQHQFHGRALMPTVGVIEAVRAASRSLGRPIAAIENLVVHRGLVVEAGEQRRAQLVLDREGKRFEVLSAADPENGGAWSVHFSGELSTRPGSRPRVDVSSPVGGRAGEDYYRELAEAGAELGPYFRRLSQVVDTADAAIGVLTPDKGGGPDQATCALDTALHLFWAALPKAARPASGGFLPVSFDRIEVFAPIESATSARATITARDKRSLSIEAGLYDAQGDAVLIFGGARYFLADLGVLAERGQKSIRGHLYATEWIEAKAPPPAKPGRWLLLGRREGIDVAALTTGLAALGHTTEAIDERELASRSHGAAGVIDLRFFGRSLGSDRTGAELVGRLVESSTQLAKSLTSVGERLDWILVTQRAQAIGVEAGDPAVGALLPLLKVAALEQQTLRLKALDVESLSTVPSECVADDESSVVHRGSSRRVARLSAAPAIIPGPLTVRADATYVITGGNGALGLEAARQLIAAGARHLALLSRRGVSAEALQGLTAPGVSIRDVRLDVADSAQLSSAWASLEPPVAGVIHAAGVVEDGLLVSWDRAAAARVYGPKVAGAFNLHRQCEGLRLDFFIAYSSATATIGNVGQGAYAIANGYLDALCHQRRAQGLPGTSIAFGPIAGTALATKAGGAERARHFGVEALGIEAATGLLAGLAGRPGTLVLAVDWARLLGARGDRHNPFFAKVVNRGAIAETIDRAFLADLAAAPANTRLALITLRVRGQVAEVLAIANPERIAGNVGLFDLGLDSMTAVELTERLQSRLGARLPATLVFEQPTIEAIARHLMAQLAPAESVPDELSERTEAELIELLEQELDASGVRP